jgi:hypothetical protein
VARTVRIPDRPAEQGLPDHRPPRPPSCGCQNLIRGRHQGLSPQRERLPTPEESLNRADEPIRELPDEQVRMTFLAPTRSTSRNYERVVCPLLPQREGLPLGASHAPAPHRSKGMTRPLPPSDASQTGRVALDSSSHALVQPMKDNESQELACSEPGEVPLSILLEQRNHEWARWC